MYDRSNLCNVGGISLGGIPRRDTVVSGAFHSFKLRLTRCLFAGNCSGWIKVGRQGKACSSLQRSGGLSLSQVYVVKLDRHRSFNTFL